MSMSLGNVFVDELFQIAKFKISFDGRRFLFLLFPPFQNGWFDDANKSKRLSLSLSFNPSYGA